MKKLYIKPILEIVEIRTKYNLFWNNVSDYGPGWEDDDDNWGTWEHWHDTKEDKNLEINTIDDKESIQHTNI